LLEESEELEAEPIVEETPPEKPRRVTQAAKRFQPEKELDVTTEFFNKLKQREGKEFKEVKFLLNLLKPSCSFES